MNKYIVSSKEFGNVEVVAVNPVCALQAFYATHPGAEVLGVVDAAFAREVALAVSPDAKKMFLVTFVDGTSSSVTAHNIQQAAWMFRRIKNQLASVALVK